MIRTLHRVRGASAVGARQAGETGPFGVRPDEVDDQADEQPGAWSPPELEETSNSE